MEFGGNDCDGQHASMASEVDKAETEGYRAAEEIGQLQSQEYEDPENKEYYDSGIETSYEVLSGENSSSYDSYAEPVVE